MKVLIGCINFNNYTGSELYVYELAKELVKNGIDVTVCSNIGGDLANKAINHGIKLMHIRNLDLNESFDLLHLNHYPVTELLLRSYPNIPAIVGIHSEVIRMEYPFISDRIKKYIAIRPQIKDFLINDFNIKDSDISVIYNPIDSDRFKEGKKADNDKKIILFVGSVHTLRKSMLLDLIKKTEEDNDELWIVGKEHEIKVSNLTNKSHVKLFQHTWHVEEYIKQCDETAGILLGRTTIEGWLCGKPGWIYDVNINGEVKSKKLHEVPDDIDKFKSSNVVLQIIEEYKNILK